MLEYRRATLDDVPAIDRVIRTSADGLSRKHGFPELPPGPPNPFYAHAITEQGEGAWVAADNGAVIGVSISSLYGRVWFLGYLFVDPTCQTGGIGRQLLRRALDNGGHAAAVRALVTLAFNPVSIGLYMRHDMLPLEPLYAMDADAAALRVSLAGRHALAGEILAPGPGAAERLAAIDGPLIDMDRVAAHRYLLGLSGKTCRLFQDSGGAARGYAYVATNGQVGPVAAAPPLSFRDVLETALLHAVEASERRVWIHLPGSNAPAMALAVEHGLRITMPLVLMASRRFGDLNRYIPHSPGMM